MRQLIAVTPDNSNRNAGASGSSRTWNTRNQAYGNINAGTDPLRFQSRGFRQPHQSHMVRFNERQFNSQPRQFTEGTVFVYPPPPAVNALDERVKAQAAKNNQKPPFSPTQVALAQAKALVQAVQPEPALSTSKSPHLSSSSQSKTSLTSSPNLEILK
ncbi:hypothetical protein TNCT_302591 [Trichonephila clavata]|uniref:Uncharacterized protein n=1 Tax=Trichonephila clavata TaxID=2740835 RepID=A0A8X6HLH1_TRICU|nr:hypothetical protein TNCT_302591 [Trichonephila clavata]